MSPDPLLPFSFWCSASAGTPSHSSIGAHPLSREPSAPWPATPVRNFVQSKHLPPCDLHPPQVSGPPLGSSRTNTTSHSPSGNLHGFGQTLLLSEVGFPCFPAHLQGPGAPTQCNTIICLHVLDWELLEGDRTRSRPLCAPRTKQQREGTEAGLCKVCLLLAWR